MKVEQSENVTLNADGVANDGAACPQQCEGDNVAASVENLIGSRSNDHLTGSDSPNQTTPGRSSAPHPHFGGISCSGVVRSTRSFRQPVHRTTQMLPCTFRTLRLPASSCRSSTF